MKLFISPHNDDAALFGAFTLMREKPLVLTVTDSYIQRNRGENITPEQRVAEDIEAMKILGCSIFFAQIRDDVISEWDVRKLLCKFENFDTIYAPAIQGGNPDHDLIGKVAQQLFPSVLKQYSTYAKGEWFTDGAEEIKPSPEEMTLKRRALECYTSQTSLPATQPHFKAVVDGGSEWFI